MLSIVIPVYKNEANLDRLLPALEHVASLSPVPLEVVFVVDGSPDRCLEILRERLPRASFASQLVALSRNFGSFNAILAGLEAGRGDYFAALAADLQEPPELALQFLELMRRGEAQVTFGVRTGRSDPLLSELSARLFWFLYRLLVVREMPAGGVDVFGCTRAVRDRLLTMREVNVNLIALLFWTGFRRGYVPYARQPRLEGRSAWTLRKKLRYCLESVFNFTNLPIQFLLWVGGIGVTVAVVFAAVLLVAKLTGRIEVPGYTAIALAVTFFGAIISLGLGILGQYLWLALQNIRGRPNYLVASAERFRAGAVPGGESAASMTTEAQGGGGQR